MALKDIEREFNMMPTRSELVHFKTSDLETIREEVRDLRIRLSFERATSEREFLSYDINRYMSRVRDILDERRRKEGNSWTTEL